MWSAALISRRSPIWLVALRWGNDTSAGWPVKRFIQCEHRGQSTLLPESLDDYVSDTNPVRVVDVFVDELDLIRLGFDKAVPADTGRPSYHPTILLKMYIYGYLNHIQSSRRLEREAL